MKDEGFEFSNKQLKNFLNIIMAIFAIFLLVRSFVFDSYENRINNFSKSIKEQSYHGVVIFKDYDKSNHNNPTLYFRDETQIGISGEFWSKIEKGDSLVKKKGETIITVYRNYEKFILDYVEIINSWKNIKNAK